MTDWYLAVFAGNRNITTEVHSAQELAHPLGVTRDYEEVDKYFLFDAEDETLAGRFINGRLSFLNADLEPNERFRLSKLFRLTEVPIDKSLFEGSS